MAFGKTLSLVVAIYIFAFIKHKAVFHKDLAKQNDLQKGKI